MFQYHDEIAFHLKEFEQDIVKKKLLDSIEKVNKTGQAPADLTSLRTNNERKISATLNYTDDKEQGEMLNYHENGQKKDQIIWDKGEIIGDRFSWNDKGEVIGKCTFKDGKPFKGSLFDIDKEFLLIFENGKQVDTILCDRNGVLKK